MPDHRRRWAITAAAVIGAIAPDLDVPLGLLGGWAGSGLHRGATHSLIVAPLLAWLIAWLIERMTRAPRSQLFYAALGGVLTHILSDWLNPWGAVLFWPWVQSFRGNLIHEGDLVIAVTLLVASVLAWRGRRVAAAVLLLELLPAYLIVQLWWRDHARSMANTELVGVQTAVFPTSELNCGWIILAASSTDMSVHCVSSPMAKSAPAVFHVPVRSDPFIEGSQQSPAVRELRQKIPFSFAEVKPVQGGGAVVLWRDLRIAYRERPNAKPTGLEVRLDASGKIVGEQYRWWLTVW